MKKAIKLLILVLVLPVLLSGCGANKRINQDYEYLEGISSEIIRCLDEKDSESLKAMFSVSTQNNFELDKEIEALFESYEGKATDYFLTNTSWEGGVRDGDFVNKHFNYEIRNLCTDSGNTYCIKLCVYQIYVYDQDRLGLIAISLLDSERNHITSVGGWAD